MKDRKKKIKELEEMIEVLLLAIPKEVISQKFYQSAIQKATSDDTRDFFVSLVREEKRHEMRLRRILNDLQAELSELKASE